MVSARRRSAATRPISCGKRPWFPPGACARLVFMRFAVSTLVSPCASSCQLDLPRQYLLDAVSGHLFIKPRVLQEITEGGADMGIPTHRSTSIFRLWARSKSAFGVCFALLLKPCRRTMRRSAIGLTLGPSAGAARLRCLPAGRNRTDAPSLPPQRRHHILRTAPRPGGPALGDRLVARVEPHALRPVDVVVAEQ
jgi:hypothetical protein